MQRTTIMLPENLKMLAAEQAKLQGITLGELIRTSLKKNLFSAKTSSEEDPFFKDRVFFKGSVPEDLSIKHDDALYGERH